MITHHPPRDDSRVVVRAPIIEVTVLEDRALVRRRAAVQLDVGMHRLRVEGIAPTAQDVSIRATATPHRVSDARLSRALRIRRDERPEELRALEDRLDALEDRCHALGDERNRYLERLDVLRSMLDMGTREIPVDASWGVVDPEGWEDTLGTLFDQTREMVRRNVEAFHQQQDVVREWSEVATQRRTLDVCERDFVAWADIDVVVQTASDAELFVEYVVPNAMWRPIHRAQLTDDSLKFTSRAVVWQNTGEDWSNVALVLSTARGSLGTEPPRLRDDRLSAQRRSDVLDLEVREVTVDRAPGAGPSTRGIALPGVDDGGAIQDLRPSEPSTVRGDGSPHFIDLFGFETPGHPEHVAFPEIDLDVHVKCTTHNASSRPILAGPVELVAAGGSVGWGEVLYVAPGATFELGFGPDSAVRMSRAEEVGETSRNPVDAHLERDSRIRLFLSNLGDTPRTVRVTERVPVSEIEHLQIDVVEGPAPDRDGFIVWEVELEPHGRTARKLHWRARGAPALETLPV